jgi:hypothetical protein
MMETILHSLSKDVGEKATKERQEEVMRPSDLSSVRPLAGPLCMGTRRG